MDIKTIIIRLILATIIAGVIGYEREFKNRPAGLRTHILVGVGATVIAMIQVQIGQNAIQASLENPGIVGILQSDQSRLIAQVISGIGFLGAGTIIVHKRSIVGLTTAASLWTAAGLGIAIGMGFYTIAIIGSIVILLNLFVVHKIIVVPSLKKVEVKFVHRKETKEFITNYFKENQILIRDVNFTMNIQDDYREYTNIYTIELPRDMNYPDIIEDLSVYRNIIKIRIVTV